MKLKNLIILNTLPILKILTEEKVTPFVRNVINRYTNNFRASRLEAAKIYANKNIKDKGLYDDDMRPLNPWKFRIKSINVFKKINNTNMTEKEFETILDNYLLNYDKQTGFLLLS